MNRLRQADAILGVVVAVFGIVVWLLANEIPLGGGTTLSARFLPHLLVALYAATSIFAEIAPDRFLRMMPGGEVETDAAGPHERRPSVRTVPPRAGDASAASRDE